MQNMTTIADASYAVIAVLLIIPMSGVGLSAYRSTLAGRQFEYKFDKRRLPLSGKVLAAELGASFLYMLILSLVRGNSADFSLGAAIAFSLLVIPLAALSCVMSVCYVPLDFKYKPAKKPTRKGKNNSWLV